ncbi:MAG: type 1 glutamine amidotransferase, partial [Candidatus Eremiobacteraeota bacterium]|nr:type 1 glutamine amidotransferase [Candidatus Eremiobacteraeota bacterium]
MERSQSQNLNGMRVAVLLTDGFEQVELTEPMRALQSAGAKPEIVSPAKGKVQGMNHDEKGDTFPIDVPLDRANADEYDALLLPGGTKNPDKLRLEPKAIEFVRTFVRAGKPIAAICHGPWTLIDADGVRGKRMTSWPSLQTDLRNAGANWVDEMVVVHDNLVTSRKPDDLPAFNEKMIQLFAQARQRVPQR